MSDFDPFERRLAAALRSDADQVTARFEPQQIARAAIASAHRRAVRVPRGFSTPPMFARLAAAGVIGAVVVGGAFFASQRGQLAVVGGPSQTPAIASPTPDASASAGPGSSIVPARAPSWTATGSMVTSRVWHAATLLADGKVLVFGGFDNLDYTPPDNGLAASVELYDPTTGTWTATGRMVTLRQAFTATLLRDGRVLVAGGIDPVVGEPLASAELYDPTTGRWTATASMHEGRNNHAATLLPDGRVLEVGAGMTAELYDPDSGTWTATGSLVTAMGRGPTATLLPDGTVLVVGAGTTAELYDPVNGTWTVTGRMVTPRIGHSATLLSDGRVLVAGGQAPGRGKSDGPRLASAELYTPATGTWSATGSMITAPDITPYACCTPTLLHDGTVLVPGGVTAPAELYDPVSGSWTATASMRTPRNGYTATMLPDGRVLVTGGQAPVGSGILASAELYAPGSGQ